MNPPRKANRPLRALLFVLAAASPGFMGREQAALPDFDRRSPSGVPSAEQRAAVLRLKGRVPSLRVDFHPIIQAPEFIFAQEGFLTGARDPGKALPFTTGVSRTEQVAQAFLDEHRDLFGHGPQALAQARLKSRNLNAHNGLESVVWHQQVGGIPVFEAVLIAHTTQKQELVAISSGILPEPETAIGSATPTNKLSMREAVAFAASNLGTTLGSLEVSPVGGDLQKEANPAEELQHFTAPGLTGLGQAKLVWLPTSRDHLRLCWDLVLMGRTHRMMYRLLVDAQSGDVWLRRCLTESLALEASYRVFTGESPTPLTPGLSGLISAQPAEASRNLVTLTALSTNGSPVGWIAPGANETLGNNVDSHTDWEGNDQPDLPRPQGSPFRVFDFPLDLSSQAPSQYGAAAVVEVFYWCNWMHDRLYDLGFTEAAGNFQTDNFGRGGLGNDALLADAQDGGGFNNANMSTPPDGMAPRMQLFLFPGPDPARDTDLDSQVILHEYTHGLSNRHVGGGTGISALQSRGLGEGWSDFYALALLSRADEPLEQAHPFAAYSGYFLEPGFDQNYYFGVRHYPYSTDLALNPLTFKDIDPSQASVHPGVPRSPIVGYNPSEIHSVGEVWCVMLWDARANLIAKYGWTAGNQLILQLVTDGMNLTPPNPTFAQARDAILLADLLDTNGANFEELSAAFARRGLGAGALAPANSTTRGVVESFDLPDELLVNPAAYVTTLGTRTLVAGTNCVTFAVSNAGPTELAWTVWSTQPWLIVTPAGGSLAPGGSSSVAVCLQALRMVSLVGANTASIVFSNLNSGRIQTRVVALPPPPVTLYSQMINGKFTLSFIAPAGRNYVVEYKNAINDVTWLPWTTFAGDDEIKIVSDLVAGNRQRFFRVRVQ